MTLQKLGYVDFQVGAMDLEAAALQHAGRLGEARRQRLAALSLAREKQLSHETDAIIVSMYGRVRTGQARSVALPEPGMTALNALLGRRAPLVGISFGNPYLLLGIPKLQTYLVAYGDMPSLQEAAAKVLLGKADVTGRLPISLPGMYPRGTGIQLKGSKK